MLPDMRRHPINLENGGDFLLTLRVVVRYNFASRVSRVYVLEGADTSTLATAA